MSLRQKLSRRLATMFRSPRGQMFLDRWSSRLDAWRGYGAGVYVEESGETVLFDLVKKTSSNSRPIVIFDVGANIGNFTTAALNAFGSRAVIHAFEPARDVFAKLSRRFAGDDRVKTNNFAFGRLSEKRALFGIRRDTGMASLVQRRLDDGETGHFQENVKVISLNEYCNSTEIDQIDLLKMDVEGVELEVLTGAEPLFEAGKIGLCSFEFGGCNLDSRTFLRDFFEFFGRYGMEIFRITPTGTIVRLPCYHEGLEKFTTTNYVAMRPNDSL